MIIFVGLGGVLGASIRFLLGKWIASKILHPFPYGTWMINISGAFLLGLLSGMYIHGQIPEGLWFLLGVGFCGAYTTFSTFGYETVGLMEKKRYEIAIIYVLSSVIVGLFFGWIGLMVA